MAWFCLWGILKQVQDVIIRCSVMLNLLQHLSVLLIPHDLDFMGWFCRLKILRQVQDDIIRCSVMLNLLQHLSVLSTPHDPDCMYCFFLWGILKQVQDDIFRCSVIMNFLQHLSMLLAFIRSRFYGLILPLRDPETSSGWHNSLFSHAEFTSASFNVIGFHTIQIWWVAAAFGGSWNKFRMTWFGVQSYWIYFSIFQCYWLRTI